MLLRTWKVTCRECFSHLMWWSSGPTLTCQVSQALPGGLWTSPHTGPKRLLSPLRTAAEPAGSISKPSFRASTGAAHTCPSPYLTSRLPPLPRPGSPGPCLAPGTTALGLAQIWSNREDPSQVLPGLSSTETEQTMLTL